MAMEGTESTDLAAQRAELEAVLHSEGFARAPTLAHLLSYLCEKRFAGQLHQIKEYSVGVEVFHRGASFDQNSDSIVRVEANRLRKRLATYYAGAGASHRLHITIPLGQYVPEFESAAPLPSAVPPTPADPPPPGQPGIESAAARQAEPWFRLSGRRTRWFAAAVAVLLLGLVRLACPAADEANPAGGSIESAV
jgi:hypothetical protein